MSETADSTQPSQSQQVRLVDVPVSDENSAINLIAAFLNLAQQRGAYSLDEAAKIFECIKIFQKEDSEAKSANTPLLKPV